MAITAPPAPAAQTRSDRDGGHVPIIEARDVHLAYGSVTALDGTDLAVASGEWIAVTGPSGSGKSTLLSLFAALDEPDRWEVRFRGTPLADERHLDHYRRCDVGLVFQLHNLIAHLDARHNVEIAMLGTGRHRAARKRAALDLLEAVQLGGMPDRRPPEMSGGERQRVAIARALANRPSVLLADEPTGNLDPQSAANVVEVFRRLHRREGTTIVMVTHDRAIAAAADRTVVLGRGRILAPSRPSVWRVPSPAAAGRRVGTKRRAAPARREQPTGAIHGMMRK